MQAQNWFSFTDRANEEISIDLNKVMKIMWNCSIEVEMGDGTIIDYGTIVDDTIAAIYTSFCDCDEELNSYYIVIGKKERDRLKKQLKDSWFYARETDVSINLNFVETVIWNTCEGCDEYGHYYTRVLLSTFSPDHIASIELDNETDRVELRKALLGEEKWKPKMLSYEYN